MALGASAGRIERQLLTESLLLAAVAGVLGSLLGWWGLRAFVVALGDQFPPWVDVGASPRTAAFAVAIVLATTLLFGLVPALQVRRQDVRFALAASPSRSTTASLAQRRVLHGLVVVEIALAAVLLAAGGLLFRAYANLRDVDPGFRVDGIAGFRLSLPEAKYRNGLEQRQLHERLAERLATLPGVEKVGVISCPPLTCHWGSFFAGEGVVRPPDAADPVTLIRVATPDYFATMDIRLLRGRLFRRDEWTRDRDGFRAVVVNESFARHMWPGVADPTGRRVRYRGDTAHKWMTVVGVTKDDRHYGVAEPMRPGIFFPITQIDTGNALRTAGFLVRTSLDPAGIIPVLRAAVRDVDPELPLFEAGPMRSTVERSLATRRILATSLAIFAAVALTLAIGGIYAVLSYVVGRRRHEIGIRVALGAQRRDVLGLIVRQGLGLVAAGLVVGIPLALAASRALSSLLVGVGPRDPLTYAVVALLLALTGVAAALVPAWRAARVEPTVALAEGG
jgi:predicted permease